MALLSGFDQIDPANDSFSDWLTKTNEMLLIIRGNTTPGTTQAMTANSLPGGSMTWGNATLFGQLTANTMVVLNNGGNDGSDDNVFANGNFGGLRGGDWNPVTNTITADTLYIVSNTTYTDESVEVYVDSTYGLIVEQNIEARHDVLFVGTGGSNTNPKMHWEDADNILSFNDNVRAVFGKDAGSEVSGGTGQFELLYVDADNRMYANTENLDIRANTDVNFITDNFELKSDIGSELYISADVADNSTVKLYYEGNVRMSTNTYGITVHGDAILEDDLVIFDNNKILMGGSTTYDGTEDLTTYKFQMFTDGSDAFIDAEDRDLYLRVKEGFELTTTGGAIHFITANTDGSSEVVLYNNGTARLETTGSQVGEVPGIEIFGEANTTTLRVLTDANFDGFGGLDSNNVHWDASANTWNYRDATKITLGDSDDWEMFYLAAGRAYSNTDNMDIRARTDMNMITDTLELKSETGSELYMSANVSDNSTVRLYYEGVERLQTNTNGVEVTGELVANGGIVTYNNQPIEMGGANYAAAHNFTIVTDGTDTTITETTNDLLIRVEDNFRVTDDTGVTSLIVANTAGEVTLYHNNVSKLQTNTTGIEVYGEANTQTARILGDANFDGSTGLDSNNIFWDASANTLYLRDDTPMYFGDDNDLLIVHDGVNSLINENGTGALIIEGTNMVLRATDDSRYLEGIDGSHVLIYSPDDSIALTANNNQVHITDLANTNTLRVRSTSLFENDISIEGSTSGEALSWDKTANTLNFNDNNFATFGTSGDLNIHHNASDSFILNGLGDLVIRNTANDKDVLISSDDGAGGVTDYVRADGSTGEVQLSFYGADKLVTKTYGVDVTGQVSATEGFVTYNNQKIEMGGTVYADPHLFEIYTDGSNSYITEVAAGDLNIQANNLHLEATDGTDYFVGTAGANTAISYGNGDVKLTLHNAGVNTEGEANTDTLRVQSNAKFEDTLGNINLQWQAASKVLDFADGARARFGDDDDLQIWHSGTNSFIADSGTGNLNISATNLVIEAQDGSEYITALDAGSVKIFYAGDGANNVARVTTTNIGVDIEGEANTDSLRVQGDAQFESDALTADEAALTWSASGRVLNFNTNAKATFGTADELQVYYSDTGNNSIIAETGSGNLVIDATNLILRASDDSRYLEGIDGSHVRIYSPDDTVALTANNNQVHITDLANTATLRVRSTSLFENDISIEGSNGNVGLNWDKSANTLNFNDNNFATFGTGGDLTIRHDATDSHIENATGELYVESDELTLRSITNTEPFIVASVAGSVDLYYDGNKKIETTDTGATITGTLISDGVTVGDDEIIQLGTSLQLYNDSANSYIKETGSGDLNIQANGVIIEDTAGTNYISGAAGGAVKLYWAGGTGTGEKLATVTDGINITGSLDVSANVIVSGNTFLLGDTIDLGNSANDVISVVGIIDTDLIPTPQELVLSQIDRLSNEVTASTVGSHGFKVGQQIEISGVTGFNGSFTITAVTDRDTFTYSEVAANASGTVDGNSKAISSEDLDLGSSTNKWANGYFKSTISTVHLDATGDVDIAGDLTVTANTSAANFSGAGANITSLNASNIDAGTIDDAYLPGEISSNISGTSAQSNTIAIADSATDTDFRVAFAANTGAYREVYADSTFLYNPNDNQLYVDNLTVSTQINLPTTVSIALGVFDDITVSNTATILNLEVESLEANGVAFTGTGGDVTTTSATVIDSFPIAQTRGFKYFIHGEVTNDDTKGYAVEVNVITTDTGADTKIFYTRYGEVESGMSDVTLVPELAANNTHIDLMATCDSATGTAIHRFNVLKIETRDNT